MADLTRNEQPDASQQYCLRIDDETMRPRYRFHGSCGIERPGVFRTPCGSFSDHCMGIGKAMH